MTLNQGPPRSPDWSYSDAEAALAEDVRRLGHLHEITGWGLLGNGKRFLVCSCNRQARTDELFWTHIHNALAKERGPETKK